MSLIDFPTTSDDETDAAQAYRNAAELVHTGKNIAVIGHIRPDGDAIGSVCAVVRALRNMGKTAHGFIGQEEKFDTDLATIPGADEIACTTRLPRETDLAITVDCGDIGRTGDLGPQLGVLREKGALLVIDHHATNRGFGSVNLIFGGIESTTMVLWDWFCSPAMAVDIDPPIAQALYSGLVTDTGSFRWGTPAMHVMASDLLSKGADCKETAYNLMDVKDADSFPMIGKVLAGARLYDDGDGIVILPATHDLIAGYPMGAVESLTEYIRAVRGRAIGVLIKEYLTGRFQVSFRSASVTVSQIAQALGGGGHDLAAGATLTAEMGATDLESAIALIRSAYAQHPGTRVDVKKRNL